MIRYPLKKGILGLNKKMVVNMTNKDLGWLIIILLKENDFDFENYKILLKEYNLIELFKIYINLLSKIKDKDAHMHSCKDNK